MKTYSVDVKLPSLTPQTQWFSGKPQKNAGEKSRMLYDFSDNTPSTEPGHFSQVSGEDPDNRQESSICFADTGELALFFNGKYIYDANQNKINKDNPLETLQGSLLTSVIAPSLTGYEDRFAYNVFMLTMQHMLLSMPS